MSEITMSAIIQQQLNEVIKACTAKDTVSEHDTLVFSQRLLRAITLVMVNMRPDESQDYAAALSDELSVIYNSLDTEIELGDAIVCQDFERASLLIRQNAGKASSV